MKFGRGAARLREDDHPEKRRMSLLQRLASVGLGRRDQDEQELSLPAAPVSAPLNGPVSPERLTGRPMPRPSEPRALRDTARAAGFRIRQALRTTGIGPARQTGPCA